MKERLKTFGIHFGLAIVGLIIGTAGSAPLNGIPLDSGDFVGALVFAPFEMTIGIPILFNFYTAFAGTVVSIGAVLCIASFVWTFKSSGHWTRLGVLLGSTLWSLGNIAVFGAFMSV